MESPIVTFPVFVTFEAPEVAGLGETYIPAEPLSSVISPLFTMFIAL